jgi:hypothetical protein
MREKISLGFSNDERIGRLETSVEGLHSEFSDIRITLRTIEAAISRSKETNWSVILAGIAIVGSLWLAAIRPITQDIERQNATAKDIATAVLVKEEKITAQRIDFERLSKDVESLQSLVTGVHKGGSADVAGRLSLLEFQLKEMEPGKNQTAK